MSSPHLDLGAMRNAVASLEGGLEVVGNSAWFNARSRSNFRDILRIAGEKALIVDVEAWLLYRGTRGLSAHI